MRSAVAALVGHSVRRSRGILLGMAGVLAGFQLLLAAVAGWLQTVSAFGQLGSLAPPAVRQLMGQSLLTVLSVSGVVALGYFHTAVEAALVILVLVIASEPADELESGFTDLVLSRRVPRTAVMARTSALLIAGPTFVVAAMGIGTAAGAAWILPPEVPGPSPRLVWSLMLNLWALAIAWGGIAMAVSAFSRRRGRVTSWVGLAALTALLIDYLARAWAPIQPVAWLSPFHYYSPIELVMGAAIPVHDVATLLSIGAGSTCLAWAGYSRRDL